MCVGGGCVCMCLTDGDKWIHWGGGGDVNVCVFVSVCVLNSWE